MKAVRTMDNTTLDRDAVDKLVNMLTKTKYRECMEKVTKFAKEHPEATLSKEEQFLLEVGRPGLRILESLNLWRFREDCDIMEREIGHPLAAIKAAVQEVRASKELALVFSISLQVVNYMKSQNYKGLNIEDLSKLENTKDKDSQSLLFHIVRKVVVSDPKFEGFPPRLVEALRLMAKVDLATINNGLQHMEEMCR